MTSFWSNFPAFIVSQLKAWFGDAATAANQFGYQHLPKIVGDHSHMPMMIAMSEGKIDGFFAMGQNPAVGGQNASLQRKALAKLKWMVVRDLYETETASFWKDAPEIKRGELNTRDIQTEVFLLPAAGVPEMDGSFTNTQRLVQWHDKAVDPPEDAHSDIWFTFHLGRRLQELYRNSENPRDWAIKSLVWDYVDEEENRRWRIKDEPSAARILKEVNGYNWQTKLPLSGFADIKDDGTTACGAWIYTGIFAPDAQHPNGVNRAASRQGDDWTSLGWGFAWPANRRIMYNRASADPQGNPWPKEARFAREHGRPVSPAANAAPLAGYVYWDAAQRRWIGYDVPDFPPTKAPDTAAQPNGVGLNWHNGASPFIMKADGKGWLYVPSGLVDGPLPTHYEPYESPVHNIIYRRQEKNPVAVVYDVPGNTYAEIGVAGIPACAFNVPADGASSKWQHEPLAALAGRVAARVVLRDFDGAWRGAQSEKHGLGRDLHAARLDPGEGAGHAPHSAVPSARQNRPSRGFALALGLQGGDNGRRGQRSHCTRRRSERDDSRVEGLRVQYSERVVGNGRSCWILHRHDSLHRLQGVSGRLSSVERPSGRQGRADQPAAFVGRQL